MNNASGSSRRRRKRRRPNAARPRPMKRRVAEGFPDKVTPELATFIAEQDTVFLATANADGAPYIQHRGGPKGFIKVIDERTLGFADYRGNRQYITLANLSENDRAYLFLLDPARRQRIKLWGRARVVENDPGAGREAVRQRLQGAARARHLVHHRGLGRELLVAHRHALHRGRDRRSARHRAGQDRRARSRECAAARAARVGNPRNESRQLSRQLHPRHSQHGEDHRHGRLLAEGEPAELFRIQISDRARLPRHPGQSRACRQRRSRPEDLRQARRHSRAGGHDRYFPRLRTRAADRAGGAQRSIRSRK